MSRTYLRIAVILLTFIAVSGCAQAVPAPAPEEAPPVEVVVEDEHAADEPAAEEPPAEEAIEEPVELDDTRTEFWVANDYRFLCEEPFEIVNRI